MATPDQAIAEVRRLYELAQKKLAATPEATLSSLTLGLFSNDDQAAEKKALSDLTDTINLWSTTERTWAEHGVRDTDGGNGGVYTWSTWFDFGQVLASDINAQAQDAVDADMFIADERATVATAQDVEKTAAAAAQGIGGALLNKWFWLGLGGVALVGGGLYVRSLLPRRAAA